MAKFWLCAAVGFYLLQLCLAEIGLNISCRYAGVFHVEKNRRYSLSREDATALCKALNSTIPTMEQMQKAYDLGFETCRYGYIEDKIVIPRQKPYYLCAANNTGIYILASNISDQYDTYCFNASETRDVVCEPVIKLYSAWPNDQTIIDISNADGSRYIGGKKYTERPPVVTDDDSIVGSGTANDSGTTDPTMLRTLDDFTHSADVTKVIPYDGDDEDSTHGPWTHDERSGQDGSRDHSSKDSYEKLEDLAEDHRKPGSEENKYDGKNQLSQSTPGEVSNYGKHHENSTQGHHVPGNIPLLWQSEEHSENNTTSNNDVKAKDGHTEEEGSISATLKPAALPGWDPSEAKEQYPPSTNENSEENDDDGGGDDDDREEGSGHLNPESFREWNNSGDKEPDSPDTNVQININSTIVTTAVVSSNDVKQEDSAHDSLRHGVYAGWDSEVKYTTNETREDVPPGIVPLGDREHSTAVSSSDGFFKQEDSTQHSLDGTHTESETEDMLLTNTTSDVLHPGFVSTHEKENSLDKESFHTAVFFNESSKHEESDQDQLSPDGKPGPSSGTSSSTNRTIHGVLETLIPPNEDDHENESSRTALTSHDGTQYEDTSRDSLSPLDYPRWGSEDLHPTNNSWDDVPKSFTTPSENENQSTHKLITDVVSSGGMKHEETTPDPLLHGMHPERGSEDRYPISTSSEETVPGIIPPTEKEYKNESIYTVVVSAGGTDHEDSTHDKWMHGIHYEKGNEDGYPANTSRNDVLPGIISSSERKHEKDLETSHTAVASSDNGKQEDSTQKPLVHIIHPVWGSEDEDLMNTTKEDVPSGILPERESNHERETLHTAVISKDDSELEDSTPDPHMEGEDKYLTNSSRDEVLSGIIPLTDKKHEHEKSHTAVVPNGGVVHEDATQDPLTPEPHPGSHSEDRHLANTSTDNLVSAITPPVVHEKENSHKVVDSTDDAKYEDDVTHDPTTHVPHNEWNNEKKYPTNSTEDEAFVGIISPTENDEDKIFHTAVIHNDDVYHEDSTQQPLPPVHQPGQDPEEKYPTNTSRDGILTGVATNRENEHDPLYTVSPNDAKEEDSTPEPVIPDIQKGSEEKYPTKSTEDVLFHGIVPRKGISHKNKTDHTAVVTNNEAKNEESTQDPRWHELQPEWNNRDELPVNNTLDEAIPGVFPEINSGSERQPSSPTANENRKSEGQDQDLMGGSSKSQPRMAHIPDWLIIVASLVALALILGVCIAVNSRRRCGQKQKLVINNGKGTIDDKNMGGLNGEASKSQEMMHLVHKEQPEDRTGPHDEFLAIDETQNQQDMDLKTGV